MIATPTLSVKSICEYLRAAVKQGVLVTDVASVKGSVVRDAETVFGSLPENFIPGHPIAGSEKSGIDAVNAELFIRLPFLRFGKRRVPSSRRCLWMSTTACRR